MKPTARNVQQIDHGYILVKRSPKDIEETRNSYEVITYNPATDNVKMDIYEQSFHTFMFYLQAPAYNCFFDFGYTVSMYADYIKQMIDIKDLSLAINHEHRNLTQENNLYSCHFQGFVSSKTSQKADSGEYFMMNKQRLSLIFKLITREEKFNYLAEIYITKAIDHNLIKLLKYCTKLETRYDNIYKECENEFRDCYSLEFNELDVITNQLFFYGKRKTACLYVFKRTEKIQWNTYIELHYGMNNKTVSCEGLIEKFKSGGFEAILENTASVNKMLHNITMISNSGTKAFFNSKLKEVHQTRVIHLERILTTINQLDIKQKDRNIIAGWITGFMAFWLEKKKMLFPHTILNTSGFEIDYTPEMDKDDLLGYIKKACPKDRFNALVIIADPETGKSTFFQSLFSKELNFDKADPEILHMYGHLDGKKFDTGDKHRLLLLDDVSQVKDMTTDVLKRLLVAQPTTVSTKYFLGDSKPLPCVILANRDSAFIREIRQFPDRIQIVDFGKSSFLPPNFGIPSENKAKERENVHEMLKKDKNIYSGVIDTPIIPVDGFKLIGQKRDML